MSNHQPEFSSDHDKDLEAGRMGWREHVQDLRHSLVIGCGSLLVIFVISLCFFDTLYTVITQPLYDTLTRLDLEKSIKFRTVQGAFFFHIKIALLSALTFGMPVLTYQIWRFVAPGLYKSERVLGLALVFMTTLFFASGVLFGYYMIMPVSFDYLLSYAMTMSDGSQLLPDITLEDYVSTFTKLIIATGLAFETPVFIGFLSFVGIVNHQQLIDGWRWALVSSFIIAAILTPPDYVTQTLLALPLMFFYVLSIGIAWYITQKRERKLNQ